MLRVRRTGEHFQWRDSPNYGTQFFDFKHSTGHPTCRAGMTDSEGFYLSEGTHKYRKYLRSSWRGDVLTKFESLSYWALDWPCKPNRYQSGTKMKQFSFFCLCLILVASVIDGKYYLLWVIKALRWNKLFSDRVSNHSSARFISLGELQCFWGH